jgi:outer membrane protein assembly factor BamB
MESGEVALVQASPQSHRELARFPALSDRTWNHPVVAGGRLLVRNDREAACYELPLKHRIAKDQ